MTDTESKTCEGVSSDANRWFLRLSKAAASDDDRLLNEYRTLAQRENFSLLHCDMNQGQLIHEWVFQDSSALRVPVRESNWPDASLILSSDQFGVKGKSEPGHAKEAGYDGNFAKHCGIRLG